MRGFLVRVGLDQAYGGGNAPVEPSSGEFVYVPIPEKLGTPFQPGLQRSYDEFTPALTAFEQRHALAPGSLALADDTAACPVHLDPDFATLTYGDQGARRGAGVATLEHGDLLAFFAELRPVRPCEQRLVYALVGLFVVDEVLRAFDVPPERWGENAHTRKLHPGEPDIVVRAQRGVSGRLERCLPIGEWRNRAYRVRHDLLEAWGELSVRDGFIQRSAVPPAFLDATRFYDWFLAQQPRLLAENNPATVTQLGLPAEDGP